MELGLKGSHAEASVFTDRANVAVNSFIMMSHSAGTGGPSAVQLQIGSENARLGGWAKTLHPHKPGTSTPVGHTLFSEADKFSCTESDGLPMVPFSVAAQLRSFTSTEVVS